MRRKNYTQRINGKLLSVTLMPTYGTLSYLYSEKVGLPKTIDRKHNEPTLAFRKRVQRIKNSIEADLRKIMPSQNTGIWDKDKYAKTSNVHHDYVISELKR